MSFKTIAKTGSLVVIANFVASIDAFYNFSFSNNSEPDKELAIDDISSNTNIQKTSQKEYETSQGLIECGINSLVAPKKETGVDFKFIMLLEGVDSKLETKGYAVKGFSSSGVTIAGGVDLKDKSIEYYKDNARLVKDGLLSEKEFDYLMKKLSPFFGLKGNSALKKASQLKITDKEAYVLNQGEKNYHINKISSWYSKNNVDNIQFGDLSSNLQTVLVSLTYNIGPSFGLNSKSSNYHKDLRKAIKSNDFQKLKKLLSNPKEKSSGKNNRRKTEAAYLSKNDNNIIEFLGENFDTLSEVAKYYETTVVKLKSENPDLIPTKGFPIIIDRNKLVYSAKEINLKTQEEANRYGLTLVHFD